MKFLISMCWLMLIVKCITITLVYFTVGLAWLPLWYWIISACGVIPALWYIYYSTYYIEQEKNNETK